MKVEKLENSRSDQNESHAPPAGASARRSKKHGFRLTLVALIAGLLLALLLIGAILPRIQRHKKITGVAQSIQDGIPTVNVVLAEAGPATYDLELPGNIEAIQIATISARTSGYLHRWYVDIGDRVRAGQVLADIDTPEVDQELQEARATLLQARASLGQAEAGLRQATTNMEFARVSFQRWQEMAEQHIVPDQDRDQMLASYNAAKATVSANQANINAAQATIAANEANVQRLVYLQGFKRVTAPFVGIVTARNVEVGSLINAGGNSTASSTTGATPSGVMMPGNGTTQSGTGAPATSGGLFQIARIDTLRIFVSVPQTYVNSIREGLTTRITIKEFPQQVFTGRVVRTTSALDQASRTLLTEVQTPNPNSMLLPGMYATVKFGVALAERPVRIPATALIVRADGTQVAVVTPDQKVHFQTVVIGRDYGDQLDIISGLEPGATLIVNLADGVQDGAQVRVAHSDNPTQGQTP
ncbi:MAG: efflux RND transporter periplasmic adaptor subunit [Blastocatellia bacterium]